MTKYRPHRGTLDTAMAEMVEVADKRALVEHMRKSVQHWYPPDQLPTLENTTIEPYAYDARLRWDTYVVKVNGSVWGFTDGPLAVGEICPYWPDCGCGTQSGPHTCEWRARVRA
jgi:hypothetical protein